MVKARVTVRTNLEHLIGGAEEAAVLARIGEGIVTTKRRLIIRLLRPKKRREMAVALEQEMHAAVVQAVTEFAGYRPDVAFADIDLKGEDGFAKKSR